MTKLHFSYKDIFRALRLGFSAKKVWLMLAGLLVGFVGYSGITYLAHLVAGNDLLTIWEEFGLLPFPEPPLLAFTWYSWLIYAAAVLFFVCSTLIVGTAVSKVTYEQLRGDEFYESREAIKFAFRHLPSVLASPLLILGFIAVIVVLGLILSLIGAIPYFGEVFCALLAIPAFAASLFIVYLVVVFLFGLLLSPSIVGATRNDTFDTIFEVFSCVNEQPARLVWYLTTTAALAKVGSFLLSLASVAAVRIGCATLKTFTGNRLTEVLTNAAYYFRVNPPSWRPELPQQVFVFWTRVIGLPRVSLPADYLSIGWSADVAALLFAACLYGIALMVMAYGCSVWYAGCTVAYAVLAKKKDDKNVLELPEDDEDLTEPVVQLPEPLAPGAAPATEPGGGQPPAEASGGLGNEGAA